MAQYYIFFFTLYFLHIFTITLTMNTLLTISILQSHWLYSGEESQPHELREHLVNHCI